ncbi:MAG: glycosyltransferase family 4 protein, partial [Candidatus Omnitrophica bacterium]|nr:glycosyltransferase family 4 protein [Candidatus Omnitrophota bacterium]
CGYVGRLRHEKGVDILFEAFGRVYEKHGDIQLLVVGDGPDLAQLREKYRKSKWWKNIVFAGPQSWENAMMHFSLMDMVVVPSRFEGFGLTAIEAMASSRAVVASDTGGLKEVVEHEKSGLLFRTGDVHGLSEILSMLIEQPDKLSRLSENAGKRAREFDITLYNEKVDRFYKILEHK